MWSTYKDPKGVVHVQVTNVQPTGTTRVNYKIENGEPVKVKDETTDYDPRTRDYYKDAVAAGKLVWSKPRVFSASGKTGVTVSQPIYGEDGALSAVLVVDFDAAELSTFIRRPPLAGARNGMFTADGTILAYPSSTVPATAANEKRLLRHEDFQDPALAALFAAIGKRSPANQQFLRLDTRPRRLRRAERHRIFSVTLIRWMR